MLDTIRNVTRRFWCLKLVEAVEKVLLRKLQIRVRNVVAQNRLHGTNSEVGMVNVPQYLPIAFRRRVFLQPRWASPSSIGSLQHQGAPS